MFIDFSRQKRKNEIMAERLTKYSPFEDDLYPIQNEYPNPELTQVSKKVVPPIFQFKNNTSPETPQKVTELPQDLENGAVMLASALDALYKHLEILDPDQITAFIEQTTNSLKNTALPNGSTETHNLIWTDMIYNLRQGLQGMSRNNENLKIARETIHNRLMEDIQKDPDIA